jgi:DNA-binding XRE family transcriptional regulator
LYSIFFKIAEKFNQMAVRKLELLDLDTLIRRVVNDLKDIREDEEVTTATLAEMTGIKQPNITRMETGGSTPNLRTVLMIADALGYDLTFVKRKR